VIVIGIHRIGSYNRLGIGLYPKKVVIPIGKVNVMLIIGKSTDKNSDSKTKNSRVKTLLF
jgi:hypothetical protein